MSTDHDSMTLAEREVAAFERIADYLDGLLGATVELSRLADGVADLGVFAGRRNDLHGEAIDLQRQGLEGAKRSELVLREVARNIDGGLDQEAPEPEAPRPGSIRPDRVNDAVRLMADQQALGQTPSLPTAWLQR